MLIIVILDLEFKDVIDLKNKAHASYKSSEFLSINLLLLAPVAVKSKVSPRSTVPSGPMLATYARKGKTRRELEGERLRNERNAIHSSVNAPDLQKKAKKEIIRRTK